MNVIILMRRLDDRKNLKYSRHIPSLSRALQVLHDVFIVKTLAVPHKIRILRSMNSILSKKDKCLTCFKDKPLDWRFFWDHSISIIQRMRKAESMGSEALTGSLLNELVAFLHNARFYINSRQANEIVLIARELLRETRLITCVEGVIILVTCLPTNFEDYDNVLDEWIGIWATFDHNASWDACWLTLLTRARKYSTKFDWMRLKDFLFYKSRQLLQLPTGKGNLPQQHDFPNTFPVFYSKLLTLPYDARKVAINKISKMIYYLATLPSSAPLISVDAITITPPKLSQNGGAVAADASIPGYNAGSNVQEYINDITLFYQSLRPYFYPSNSGRYTEQLGFFMCTMISELCRHFARSSAFKILGKSSLHYEAFERPIHLPSFRYLLGTLTLLVMEGLYSKVAVMQQLCSSALKNICSLDPSLASIICPFILEALDPEESLTHSHQAPAAMHAFSLCFKSLLFPCPVVLQYLPTLLSHSLPGVDPSDTKKTTITLSMYSTILGFLPISSTYDPSSAPASLHSPYLSLLNTTPDSGPILNPLTQADIDMHMYALSACIGDWAHSLLDKIFVILEAQEEKKKKSNGSAIGGVVAECMGYLFQALKASDPLRIALEEKIITFFRTHTPINAAKICGKIMETIVNTNPTCLPKVIVALVDAEVSSGSCSSEKLAFRLRVLCGSVRVATSEAIVDSLPSLLPLIGTNFLHHKEKSIRKASCKLVKDLLRGNSAFYPVNISPLKMLPNAALANCLGAPSDIEQDSAYSERTWHIPSSKGLEATCDILRRTAITSMAEALALLQSTTSVTSFVANVNPPLTAKQIEEKVTDLLSILRKSLRGAADILGDELFESAGVREAAMDCDEGDEYDDAEEGDDYEEGGEGSIGGISILSTGRDDVIKQLSPEDARLLNTLRHQALMFLHSISDQLSALSLSEGSNPYKGLADSSHIRNQWFKILVVITCQRMATLKNVDSVLKWFGMNKKMSASMYAKQMMHILTNQPGSPHLQLTPRSATKAASWNDLLSDARFWIGHDINTNNLANRGWLQHAVRQRVFSFASLRKSMKSPMKKAYMDCLQDLLVLCSHEFDEIRHKAVKTWNSLVSRFGQHALKFVKSSIASLTQVGCTFAQCSGALAILHHSNTMNRICSRWPLLESFLHAMVTFPTTCQSISEMDKRERLMNSLMSTFVKYTDLWRHLPIQASKNPPESTSHARTIMLEALSSVGFEMILPGASVEKSQQQVSQVPSFNATLPSLGLRYEAITAFILFHLIGHSELLVTARVSEWAMHCIINANAPSQQLGAAALTKIAYIAHCHSFPTSLRPIAPMSLPETNTVFKTTLFPSASSPTFEHPAMKQFLQGISLSHPQSTGEKAQWSQGIDNILRAASFTCGVFPRNQLAFKGERSYFSYHFNPSNAGLFFCFPAMYGVQSSNDWIHIIQTMMANVKEMSASSEDERRTNNATRAEIWAGLYRAAVLYSSQVDSTILPSVEPILVSWLRESTEKLSKDFNSDWAEGVYFACTQAPMAQNQSLLTILLDGFRESLLCGIDTQSDAEGFNKYEKSLVLTRALLWADVAMSARDMTETSVVGDAIMTALIEHKSSVSPYRSMRVELSVILCILCEAHRESQIEALGPVISYLVDIISGDVATTDADGDSKSMASASEKAKALLNSASETVIFWLHHLLSGIPSERRGKILPALLRGTLLGCSSIIVEVQKMCHDTCLLAAQAIGASARGVNIVSEGAEHNDELHNVLSLFMTLSSHSSWRVRETVLECIVILAVKNWCALTLNEKKNVKDIIMAGLGDPRSEIVEVAKDGMVLYLSLKNAKELGTLTAAYTRNSEALAARERKKKRETAGLPPPPPSAASAPVDKQYLNTLQMCCCLILSFPYDLPPFLPPLVTTVTKHASNPSVQDLVMKTVQTFKSTHQDRWDFFKKRFTHEQLDDLQGAGAAHYFS